MTLRSFSGPDCFCTLTLTLRKYPDRYGSPGKALERPISIRMLHANVQEYLDRYPRQEFACEEATASERFLNSREQARWSWLLRRAVSGAAQNGQRGIFAEAGIGKGALAEVIGHLIFSRNASAIQTMKAEPGARSLAMNFSFHGQSFACKSTVFLLGRSPNS